MNWADVLADRTLQNLPYKIELDRFKTGEVHFFGPEGERSHSEYAVDPCPQLQH